MFSPHMAVEFRRYGLEKFRVLTGALQFAGALGISLGIYGYTLIGVVAAIGLSIQMALGVAVRLRIRDSWLKCFPAFFYFCANAYLAYLFLTAQA